MHRPAILGSRRVLVAISVAVLAVVLVILALVKHQPSTGAPSLAVSSPTSALTETTDTAKNSAADGPVAESVGPTTPARVARPAPSQVDAQRPRLLVLPSGAEVPIEVAATSRDGELVLPQDINHAGWWDGSAQLGDPFGPIVVAAHIDSFTQGLGVFAELLSVEPGDGVQLLAGGLTQDFRVVRADLVSKASLSGDSPLYSPAGESRLVLITCGGAYDPDRGGYQDNMVVVAVARSQPHRG